MPSTIYGRECRGRKLFSESVSFIYWITTAGASISLGNVTGRGDCECNYAVNYLKKIEMPRRLPKSQAMEDKCAINQRIYGLVDRKPKQGSDNRNDDREGIGKSNWKSIGAKLSSFSAPSCTSFRHRASNGVDSHSGVQFIVETG